MITPNALLPSQVARLCGVKPQSVDKELKRAGSLLELFEFAGTKMITLRSVKRWQKVRAKRAAAQVARIEGAPVP